MKSLLAVIAIAWLLLLPPLFTDGACSAEFETATKRVESDRQAMRTPELAATYFHDRRIPYTVYSLSQCRRAKPRSVVNCGDGPLVYAKAPVKNPVCRIYRDDEVRIHLHYDDRDRLARTVVDMSPYKSLPLPGITLHWAR